MTNREPRAALDYHEATKHSYESVRLDRHTLDWANQPRLLKHYLGLPPIALPKPDETGEPALEVIAARGDSSGERAVTLGDLAALLHFSAGITRRRVHPGGEIAFRAAACTGALYEIDLYVVCAALDGLDAGAYHYDPDGHALARLREGDFRSILAEAAGGEPALARAGATVISTGIYWRNAWKYRARTYRHFGWDNGMMLANLLAIAEARGLSARIVHGFVDRMVNDLLGLDTMREVALNLVPLGAGPPVEARAAEAPPLRLETRSYSSREVDYPAMRALHEASSLESPAEVAAWREGARRPARALPSPAGKLALLEPMPAERLPRDGIEQVIRRRGSSRKFAREPIPFSALSTTLAQATRGLAADFLPVPGTEINDLYVVAHAVEGLEPGAYFLRRDTSSLELLEAGEFRSETGYLGLEQALPGDAAAVVFFLADLTDVLGRLGNRGYRAVQLEAGTIGGRLYLAQYAQRLGATGLTFYDDDVTRFFSPHAAGKSAIFLVALGHSAKILQGW